MHDAKTIVTRLIEVLHSDVYDIDDVLDQGVETSPSRGYSERRLRALYVNLMRLLTTDNVGDIINELHTASRRCSRLPAHIHLMLQRCGVPCNLSDVAARVVVGVSDEHTMGLLVHALSERPHIPKYMLDLLYGACMRVNAQAGHKSASSSTSGDMVLVR
jgi:hypothetical protein